MADNSSDSGTFIAGFIIGGLIGAAIALLYTPQSGEETRNLVVEKGIELKDKAVETSEGVRQKTGQALSDIQKKADEFAKKSKESTEEQASGPTVPLDESEVEVEAELELPTDEESE